MKSELDGPAKIIKVEPFTEPVHEPVEVPVEEPVEDDPLVPA